MFPDQLKLAKVIPIYKTGDKKNINNYRPISISSFFSKVLEKIMHNYVMDCISEHEVIFKNQFGFRQKHSTQQAVISLMNNITSSLDAKDIVIGVFLDLKKAFDTINHKILLNKLYF